MKSEVQEQQPKLRFPEFEGTGLWEVKQLRNIAHVVMGSSPPSEAFNTNGIGLPFMQGNADIKNGFSSPRLFTSEITRECQASDTLLSVRAPVGSIAKSVHHACIGRGLTAIRAIENNSQEYLHQWLIYFEPNWKNISQGGTFEAISSNDVTSLLVNLPHQILEQTRVADCLSSLDALIAAQTQKLDALREHKRGLTQGLFPAEGERTPRLRFPEFEGAGEWEEKKAGNVFLNRIESGEDGLPIYSVTMNDGMVKRSSLERKIDDIAVSGVNKKVYRGDIAYNMMRMWQGAFGIAPEDCMVSPAYIILSTKPENNSNFFEYIFKQPRYLLLLTAHSQGLTLDRLRLYFKDFARIPLVLPKLAEQTRIADCLSSLDTLISTQSNKINELKIFKRGLMQQLFPALEGGEK